jgi:hypothetical protein
MISFSISRTTSFVRISFKLLSDDDEFDDACCFRGEEGFSPVDDDDEGGEVDDEVEEDGGEAVLLLELEEIVETAGVSWELLLFAAICWRLFIVDTTVAAEVVDWTVSLTCSSVFFSTEEAS